MRAETIVFAMMAGFFAIVTPIYWLMSYDATGTAGLTLTFFMSLILVGYFGLLARRIDDRPEDKREAEVVEGAGELGFFAPHSIWPLFCVLSLSLAFLGIVVGWWLTVIAAPLGMVSLTGLIYEYYRGEHAH